MFDVAVTGEEDEIGTGDVRPDYQSGRHRSLIGWHSRTGFSTRMSCGAVPRMLDRDFAWTACARLQQMEQDLRRTSDGRS